MDNENSLSETRSLLVEGAMGMRSATDEKAKLSFALKVSEAGRKLAAIGGMDLVLEVFNELDGDMQITVKHQWYALTDDEGRQFFA